MRLLLVALAGLAAPLAAQGRPDFEARREVPAGGRVWASTIIGDVTITRASGRTFEATAVKMEGRHGDPADVEIRMLDVEGGVAVCVFYPGMRERDPDEDQRRERNEGSTRERSPCSRNWNNSGRDRNDTKVHLTLKVPADVRLVAGTVSGDLDATGLRGDLRLSSVSGDVALADAEGPAIDAHTVSGNVTLRSIRSPVVSANTVSGDLEFSGPLAAEGAYDFTTLSGDVDLELGEPVSATMRAATFSGRFHTTLPVSTGGEERRRKHRYSATWGGGSARLELESFSGDITVRTIRP